MTAKIKKFRRPRGSVSELKKMFDKEYNTLRSNPEVMGRTPESILIGIRFSDDHFHAVYPGDEEDASWILNELIEQNPEWVDEDGDISDEIGEAVPIGMPRRIVFHNRQAIGDILMFTCAVRDFKRAHPEVEVKVESTAMHIWDYNPNISQEDFVEVIDPASELSKGKMTPQGQMGFVEKAVIEDRPVKLYIGSGRGTNQSNSSDLHFANAYRLSMEDILKVKIPQGETKPDVYLSEKEKAKLPLIEGDYWLITAGEKGDWTAKTWPVGWWQEVVDKIPWINFVQIGAAGHSHKKLEGDNVIDYVGKTEDRDTGIRDLFNLFYHASGSIGMVSFHMHLAAAFGTPCVVIAGAREPSRFTHYPGHRYLSTDGCLPCTVNGVKPRACWYCDVNRCEYMEVVDGQKVPRCMKMISPADVVNAINMYYQGGRLTSGVLGALNAAGINAAKAGESLKEVMVEMAKSTEKAKVEIEVAGIDIEPMIVADKIDQTVDKITHEHWRRPGCHICVDRQVEKWGFTWGGTSITKPDWEFMRGIFDRYDVKTALEFGCGLSTLLMTDYGIQTISYEADRYDAWSTEVKTKNPNLDIREWDAKSDIRSVIGGKFDLVFVDGPSGSQRRDVSIRLAAKYSNLIVVHDAGRKIDMEYQEKYLRPYFELMDKGGTRCHFWKRKPLAPWNKHLEKTTTTSMSVPTTSIRATPSKGSVRMVFNGRGEGGAERSTTWLMKKFDGLGYDVEYVAPSGPSGTFRKTEGLEKVRVLEATRETIASETDLLLLYVNDWLWDFGIDKVQNMFDNMKAKRKVMVVNYRLGNIGKIPWTQGWDKYIFLNSGLRDNLLKVMPRSSITPMVVLPPPIHNLEEFLKIELDYEGGLRIVRHSSQGDAKYPKDFTEKCVKILEADSEATLSLMPAPSFYEEELRHSSIDMATGRYISDRSFSMKRNQPPVSEFLSKGNCFWYWLPEGYHDQGPKVIMEAQAVGLPVVAQDHSGPADRVVNGTGFLFNEFRSHLECLRELKDPFLRKTMGQAGKEHARKEYDPNRWIEEILS